MLAKRRDNQNNQRCVSGGGGPGGKGREFESGGAKVFLDRKKKWFLMRERRNVWFSFSFV